MTDLSTTYLGLNLKNPLVASASPLSKNIDKARKLEEAGISAMVMYSLFEEQIIHESLELDHYLSRGTDSFPEALSYLPDGGLYAVSPEKYLNQVTGLKKALQIPVIGSLNGVSKGGWTNYARKIEEAGADALELNMYYLATDPDSTSADVENMQVELVAEIKSAITIPLAVKISPFVTSVPNFVKRLVEAGADGLVLFNRFYQPDVDTTKLRLSMDLDLSTSAEVRLPLLWLAILYGRLPVSLAATTGVESANDVFKYLLAGADVVMTTSSLLRHGVAHMRTLLDGLSAALEAREIASVAQIRGQMSQQNVDNPTLFERANYVRMLHDYDGSRR